MISIIVAVGENNAIGKDNYSCNGRQDLRIHWEITS